VGPVLREVQEPRVPLELLGQPGRQDLKVERADPEQLDHPGLRVPPALLERPGSPDLRVRPVPRV